MNQDTLVHWCWVHTLPRSMHDSGQKLLILYANQQMGHHRGGEPSTRSPLSNVRQEPKASVLSAYKICDLAYKVLKV
jgi:hypothetical protein